MRNRERLIDYLGAASIIIAFGGLFFGRMMLLPVAQAEGPFLVRVAKEVWWWDYGHRVMLAGMIGLIPASITMRRAFWAKSPWLSDISTVLTIFGATLAVGQFALDYAMLAAARIQPLEAGQQFPDLLMDQPFVDMLFYTLTDLSKFGGALFAIVLWRQGKSWRLEAALVSAAILIAIISPIFLGGIGERLGLGAALVAFLPVAWRIARGDSRQSVVSGT